MTSINFRCNRKSDSPESNLGEDSATFTSELGHDFSKAIFHTPTIRHERVCLVNLTYSITRMYIDVLYRLKFSQFGLL